MSEAKQENELVAADDCGGCDSIAPGESEASWNERTHGGMMSYIEPGSCPWCQAAAAGIPPLERDGWIFEGDPYLDD